MYRKRLTAALLATAFIFNVETAAAADLSIYGVLGCAIYDTEGNFMRLGKTGAYEVVNPGRASSFETTLEVSKTGYKLLGPQFKIVDRFGNEAMFPKSGRFSAAFSYKTEGRDIFDVVLGGLEGSWDNSWQRLELQINPITGVKLGCNFPSD